MIGTPPAPTTSSTARHRIGGVQRDVVVAARAQDVRERLGPIAHVPLRDEGIGDVRASDRGAVRGLRDDVVPVQVEVAADAVGHGAGALQPRRADAVGHRAQPDVVGIDEVGQHMHAAPFVFRGELHARNEGHAERCRRFGRLRPSRCRVVVGERRGAQAVPVRGRHDLRGRLRAVGVDRMQVQVARPLEASRVRHPSSVARGCDREPGFIPDASGCVPTDLPAC